MRQVGREAQAWAIGASAAIIITISVLKRRAKRIERSSKKQAPRRPLLQPPVADSATTLPVSGAGNNEGLLKDEYGDMDDAGKTFVCDRFELENGLVLEEVKVRYKTFGKLNDGRDNCMMVCHALTGNASLDTWWGGLLGPGCVFDTDRYLVVCANILGSCYGTTGPADVDPKTGRRYGSAFPEVTVRDTVNLHRRLLEEGLGVRSVSAVIGGSLGGMQSLEWAFHEDFVRRAVVIACGAHHHAWQIGISETQRQAIYGDPNWQGGDYDPKLSPPNTGLSVARMIAMFSYRTHAAYERKFSRLRQAKAPSQGVRGGDEAAGGGSSGEAAGTGDYDDEEFSIQGYLQHQGQRFLSRFDAASYVCLTKLMDSHDVGRGRRSGRGGGPGGGSQQEEEGGCYQAALRGLATPTLVLGITSDVLYPLAEQLELADLIPNSRLRIIESSEGHDGFLLEQEEISRHIKEYLDGHKVNEEGLKRSLAEFESHHGVARIQDTRRRDKRAPSVISSTSLDSDAFSADRRTI